jgi:hypothetical protein
MYALGATDEPPPTEALRLRELEFNEEEAALLQYKRESSIVQQEMLQRLHTLSTAQNECLDEYRSLLPPVRYIV